nr:Ig-like domain-containing protein [Paenibacillus sp. PL91]
MTVSKTELSLTKGEKSTLQAAILPANATNHDVEWSTSSSAVATVSSKGEVTAIAPGKATITLTSKDGGFKATTTVTVHAKQITTVDLKGNITVHIDTDAAGKANVVLSANDMNTAAAKTTNKLINIMIKPDAGTKEVAVLAPVADLKQNTGLVINTGSANTFIPSDMLVNKNGTDAAVLELSVKQVDKDKLPPAAQTFTLQNTALDFNLILDGKTISDFGGRSVEINLPYTLKMGEDPNEMVVYFINNEGKLEIVKNSSYNSATSNVHFSVKQFGKYAVAAVN